MEKVFCPLFVTGVLNTGAGGYAEMGVCTAGLGATDW